MTIEKFLDCRKVSWLCKLTFLTAEKIIDLIILKTNANVETIKTDILNLEQKLSSFAFFTVDKINIIFNGSLKHKY